MQSLILTLHIIVCVLLVILVLLQSGKEGMGVIFGGGNSSVFGSSGAGGILAKLTALMAVIFVITSLSYTYVTSSHSGSESTILNVKIEDPVQPANSTEQIKTPEQPVAPEPAKSAPPSPEPVTDKAVEQSTASEPSKAIEQSPVVAPAKSQEAKAGEKKNSANQGKAQKAPAKQVKPNTPKQ